MPGMDGLALIERLRDFVLIRQRSDYRPRRTDLAIQALRVGAYDFIQKPIERDYFISALQRAIQTRQMRRQITAATELEEYTHSLEQT